MNILCISCSKDSKFLDRSGYNVGDMCRKTGFYNIMTHNGDMLYLCPPCYLGAHELAKGIMKIVKTDYLYFPSLLKPIRDTKTV